MITRADTDKLRGLHAPHTAVLSVYLTIPLDLAGHRGLATRARELIKAAAIDAPGQDAPPVRDEDIESIAEAVTEHSHGWLGHTIAIFACAELGLFELVPVPGYLSERAVIAVRPYTRPLLAAIQRNPAYRVAVIDAKHAWVLAICDDQIETLAERTGEGVPSTGFSGWWGLEAYRIQQRIMRLSRLHYRETIGILERSANNEFRPLVLGGHESEINQFLALLPRAVRQSVAGSFSVDLQTVTPARVRELAAPVLARWAESAEARLVAEVLAAPPDTAVTTDLAGCVAAVRSRAVSQLIVADDQLVPGSACDDCGSLAIGTDGCRCADPAQACRTVPDLLDELASQALDGGGQVTAVRNPPFTAAARLRFPVTAPA